MIRKSMITALCIIAIITLLMIPVSAEAGAVERQSESLRELRDLIDRGTLPVQLDSYGEVFEIPAINLIIPPNTNEDNIFTIGLAVNYDYGYIEYGDTESILAILHQQYLSQNVVDFILSFAGIPYEQASVGYVIFQETPRLPYGHPLPEVCPVWGDRVDEIDSRSLPWGVIRIGQRDIIPGAGSGTIGHPLNASGTRYFTSVHGLAGVGTNVFSESVPNVRMGVISRSIFNNRVDVAEVNLAVSGAIISTELPHPWHPGNRISNFRGVPRQNDLVRSIRGISGTNMGAMRVESANADVMHLRNKITIFPNGTSVGGDSGAALIRVTDNAVLGTRKGNATAFDGRVFGVYTNVQLY